MTTCDVAKEGSNDRETKEIRSTVGDYVKFCIEPEAEGEANSRASSRVTRSDGRSCDGLDPKG